MLNYLATIQDGIDLLDHADDIWFATWEMEQKVYKMKLEEKELREKAIKKFDEAQLLFNKIK